MEKDETPVDARATVLANTDLLDEILQWLESTAVLRFQPVSHYWKKNATKFIFYIKEPVTYLSGAASKSHHKLAELASRLRVLECPLYTAYVGPILLNASSLVKLSFNIPDTEMEIPSFPKLVDLSLDSRHRSLEAFKVINYIKAAPNLRRLAIHGHLLGVDFLTRFTQLESLHISSINRENISQLKNLDWPRLKTLTCHRQLIGVGFEMTPSNFSDHINAVLRHSPQRFGINILISSVTERMPESLLSWALGRIPMDPDRPGRIMDLTESSLAAHRLSLSTDQISHLLSLGADPNVRLPERTGPTPLLIALAYGRTSSAISMLAHKGDCTIRYGRRGLNAYLLAATRLETIFFFQICQKGLLVSNLERDPFLLRCLDDGSTPTHLIVRANRSDAVRAGELGRWLSLQEQFGDDPKICEEAKLLDLATWDRYDTAIHMAARSSSPKCLKVLLSKIPNSDPFLRNKKGETALHLAAINIHKATKKEEKQVTSECFSAICQCLRRLSKDSLHTKLGMGFFSTSVGSASVRTSPLIAAVRAGLMTDLKLMLDTGLVSIAEIMEPFNSDGFNALLAAASLSVDENEDELAFGISSMLQMCKDVDFDPAKLFSLKLDASPLRHSVSLLHLLASSGNVKALDSLKARGSIDINVESLETGTPLCYACEACPASRLFETLNWLISEGSTVDSLACDPLARLLNRSLPDPILLKASESIIQLYKSSKRSFDSLSTLLLKPDALSIPIYRLILSLNPNLDLVDQDRDNLNVIEASIITMFPPFVMHLMESFRSRSLSASHLLTSRVWQKLNQAYKDKIAGITDEGLRRNINERVSEISRVLLQNGAPTESFPFLDSIHPIVRKFAPF